MPGTKLLGLSVLTLGAIQFRQVVEACGVSRMRGARRLPIDVERVPKERLGLGEVRAEIEHGRPIVHAPRILDFQVGVGSLSRREGGLVNRERLFEKRVGSGEISLGPIVTGSGRGCSTFGHNPGPGRRAPAFRNPENLEVERFGFAVFAPCIKHGGQAVKALGIVPVPFSEELFSDRHRAAIELLGPGIVILGLIEQRQCVQTLRVLRRRADPFPDRQRALAARGIACA